MANRKSSHTEKRRTLVENQIRLELEEELDNVKDIKKNLITMREKLLEKRPEPFCVQDILYAFFAALIIGIGFTFKGSLVRYATNLTIAHLNLIILVTLAMLIAEAYYLGYRRVDNKHLRKMTPFLFKRVLIFYLISLCVGVFLIYIFAINTLPEINNDIILIYKLVVVLSMPCATGAAITSILKKY